MTIELNLNWDGVSTTGWVDYTNDIILDEFKRNKSLDSNNDPQKSTTAEIEAYGAAYTELKTNLIDSANRYSNFYAVRILDSDCDDVYYYFKIENQELKWCDNGVCKLQLRLIEYVPVLDCIRRTTIADNTNGNFQAYPVSGVPHPRFRYCDVVKPTFLYGIIITFTNAVVLFIASLNIVLASMFGIIVWIVNFLGGNWSVPQIGFGWAEDLLGCSRGHPAPFVRSYIDNVCTLCGVTVDLSTAPTLYDDVSNTNQYYWMCLATAFTTKGIDMGGAKDYIPANSPSWTLSDLLSKIKVPFNARWFLKYGTQLYFGRKDLIGGLLWGVGSYQIDLSSADALYLLGDVCYTYNGEGKPKKLLYNYGTDPSDNIGNELLRRFRGIYEDVSGNANYNETIEVQLFEFGVASCILDGKDSAYDENVANALVGTVTGTMYEGCIKTQGDTFALAKLLIWDQSDIQDARCAGVAYDYFGSSGADIASFSDDDANFILVTSGDCKNYNYSLSFDPDADTVLSFISGSPSHNLWQFNSIDVPSSSKNTNIDIDFTLQYCCIYNTLEIYQSVLLADGVTEAEIYSLDFDHSKREIKIKAKLK